jgi:hypothetical protein
VRSSLLAAIQNSSNDSRRLALNVLTARASTLYVEEFLNLQVQLLQSDQGTVRRSSTKSLVAAMQCNRLPSSPKLASALSARLEELLVDKEPLVRIHALALTEELGLVPRFQTPIVRLSTDGRLKVGCSECCIYIYIYIYI